MNKNLCSAFYWQLRKNMMVPARVLAPNTGKLGAPHSRGFTDNLFDVHKSSLLGIGDMNAAQT
jgi:hypothetical protein